MPYFNDALSFTPFTVAEWKEVIGDQQPGGESISMEASQATIAVDIPWDRAMAFVRFALGWSFVSEPPRTGGDAALHRINPARHPRFPYLSVANVSFQGVSPHGTPGVGTKVEGVYGSAISLPQAAYNRCIATVTFQDQRWTFIEDGNSYSPSAESQRNVFFDPVPSVEIISAEGLNNLKFSYTTAGPAGPNGTAVPAPFGTLMAKVTYTMNWMWVPHEYISTQPYPILRPTRILNCVGRVNTQDFFSFIPGTVLMQAPIFEPMRFPVVSNAANRGLGFFGWNVRIPFQYFEPEEGTQTGLPPGAQFHGHQLLPWRINLKWYPAIRESGDKVFPEADFTQIFANANYAFP